MAGADERIAWGRLLRLGLGRMGLDPERFWALTPAEFMLMAGLEDAGPVRMTRASLSALEARFPDAGKRQGHEE
ncbi:MAG: phage tail assembly chaperone [Alphaproteobacteria bacterium]|nr:MAG: phage tail assembly chaperone [Alphaproteobacteria bacterium]